MVIGTPTILNLIPGKVFPVVNVNQYDAGYQKTFLLYKGAEPFNIATDMAVTIRGTKGDKNGIADSAASTVGSNLVSVTLTEQMTAVAGPNIYELRIVDMNGLLVGTVNFVMMVEPAALGEGTVISDSDLNYAADVLDRIQTEEATKNQVNTNSHNIEILQERADSIKKEVTEKRGECLVDLVLDGYIPSTTSLQGGCYTEGGNFVIYENNLSDDYGRLICVNMNTFSVVWTSPTLKLYHGNSIAYRSGKLYIAGCVTTADPSVLMNTIYVVDYSTHNSIEKTITSPAPGGIYGIAYDSDTDKFYSTNYRGTMQGQANILYEYNGIFESVSQTIELNDLTACEVPPNSSQGVACVVNGIAFLPYYEPSSIVAGFRLSDGSRAVIGNIPKIANRHKFIGEIQFVTFDGSDYYIGFYHSNTGKPGYVNWSIARIGLFKNIVVSHSVLEFAVNSDNTRERFLFYDLTKSDLKPASKSTDNTFYDLSDILTFQKNIDGFTRIRVKNTSDPNTLTIGHFEGSNLNATITPLDETKKLNIERLILSTSCINFRHCNFIGSTEINSIKANLHIFSYTQATFYDCTFAQVNGNGYAMAVYGGASAVIDVLNIGTTYSAVYVSDGRLVNVSNSFYIPSGRVIAFAASELENMAMNIFSDAMKAGNTYDITHYTPGRIRFVVANTSTNYSRVFYAYKLASDGAYHLKFTEPYADAEGAMIIFEIAINPSTNKMTVVAVKRTALGGIRDVTGAFPFIIAQM